MTTRQILDSVPKILKKSVITDIRYQDACDGDNLTIELLNGVNLYVNRTSTFGLYLSVYMDSEPVLEMESIECIPVLYELFTPMLDERKKLFEDAREELVDKFLRLGE